MATYYYVPELGEVLSQADAHNDMPSMEDILPGVSDPSWGEIVQAENDWFESWKTENDVIEVEGRSGDYFDVATQTVYTEEELSDRYEEMLNDTHDMVDIAGHLYPAGYALKQLDPIAFREAVLAYIDMRLSPEDLLELSYSE